MKVKFYDCEDFMIYETDATKEDLIEWAKKYAKTNDISKPQNCSSWNLIADTELDIRFDIEDIEVDLKIDVSEFME